MDYLRRFQERVALNRAAFDSVRQNIKIGMTELEILSIIQDAWFQASCVAFPFSGDIVSGERSADVEGEPTERKLQQGETLILDLQPGFDHCYADTTRTFFVGEPSEEIRQAYSAVVDALKQMEKLLRPGVPACKIYEKMQEVLAQYGFSCPHHAGHAVGYEKMLEPRLVPQCNTKLEEDMLVALEPGVYIPGRFGIRIENNYCITQTGCDEQFRYPLDIEYFILRDGVK